MRRSVSELEKEVEARLRQEEFPYWVREFCFLPGRRWRFDFAWPESRVALECEGGIWIQGRHTHPIGFEKDVEKYNEAAFLGWVVIRVTKGMLKQAEFWQKLKGLLQERAGCGRIPLGKQGVLLYEVEDNRRGG